ncbi:MAG TPA: anti-virulence regulator CigR family protein [Gemmatimonadales bacterium]|jgi:hypothetical protein|nr:anti-virulence regulator CigR family protein [Gemmatimonadales bacterium]
MPRPTRVPFALLLLLLLLGSSAQAQGPGRPDVKREKKEEKRQEKELKKEEKELRKIDEAERRILREYFAAHRLEVRPLPPGIAKNLALGKPLPPGLRKRYLPQPVLVRLPVYPGYSRYIVGGNIVLVDRSGIVVDIAVDIFK